MSEVAAAVRLRRQHPEKPQRVPPGCSIRVSSVGVHSARQQRCIIVMEILTPLRILEAVKQKAEESRKRRLIVKSSWTLE